ncbi:endonuclease/exonuclease/phosphatase family protein [Kiloniella majae]|uniref:endonuclease/exonuclease/phosphatase family protein n=1 Tax=Kiloniella majae TaxID=1938558 RepID=UPI000A2788B6|nr:endonuclease/exonuclease/phosphatase family protein [Kiloniella majae]
MRILLAIFLLFSFSANAETVRVATFNTFWLFDDKDPHKKWHDDVRGKEGQSYVDAIEKVAEAIQKMDADIVGLQEVEGDDVIKDLQDKLKSIGTDYPFRFTGKGGDSFTGQDVALLSKFPSLSDAKREFPDERETYLTENDPGNEKDTGLSKVLMVDLDVEGKPLSVLVLHLKSQRGGFEADRQRLAQASIVRRITLPIIQDGNHLVVMGDLNADRGSNALRRLRGQDDIGADLYQSSISKKFTGDRWTYSYKGRPQQLDHVLVSPSLRKAIKSASSQYGHGKETSDHFPIIVDLEID